MPIQPRARTRATGGRSNRIYPRPEWSSPRARPRTATDCCPYLSLPASRSAITRVTWSCSQGDRRVSPSRRDGSRLHRSHATRAYPICASTRASRRDTPFMRSETRRRQAMAIIPTVRCSRLKTSVDFYTRILDFAQAGSDDDLTDPSFVVLRRAEDILFLSSHGGDGAFGQAIDVLAVNVKEVVHLRQPLGNASTASVDRGSYVDADGCRSSDRGGAPRCGEPSSDTACDTPTRGARSE